MTHLATSLLLLIAAAPGGPPPPPESALVATAGGTGVYLWWGLPPAGTAAGVVEVQRRRGGGPFEAVARVEPERDLARARATLASATDPGSRRISLADDYLRKAEADPALDAGLTLFSTGYARLRGAAWLDAGVERGATYAYRAVRRGPDGQAVVLGEIQATAGRPTALQAERPTVAAGAEGVVIRWRAEPYVAYRLERAAGAGGPWGPADQVDLPAAALPFALERQVVDRYAPQDGAALAYRLVPLDLLGWAGPASPAATVTTADRTPPRPPTSLEVHGTAAGLTLRWQPSGSADAAGQHVWRSERLADGAGGAARLGERRRLTSSPLPATATGFEDRTARASVAYRYEVTALDAAANESRPSAPADGALRDATPPGTPAGLTAKAGEGGVVSLTWQPVPDADLWVYRVLHAVGPKAPLRLLREVARPDGTGAITIALKLDPRSQEVHRFAVAAVDRSENESLPAPPVEVRLPDHVPPPAPVVTGLDATAGAMTVRWSPPPEQDLAGFHVYRRVSGRPPARLTAKPLPADARSFRDASAPAGVALVYAVSALDKSGNEGPASEARSTATFAAPPTPPSGLTVKAGVAGKLALAWTPAPGSRGTMVYGAATSDGAPRQVGALVPGATLEVARTAGPYFMVQAIAANGTPSNLSAPVEAPPEKGAAPAPTKPAPKPAGKGT